MKNLVINSGSSSLKFSVFNENNCIMSGSCEGIGESKSKFSYKYNGEKFSNNDIVFENHEEAAEHVIEKLNERNLLEELAFVAHRIVHGGPNFVETTLVEDDETIAKLRENDPLAPLHNVANVGGISIMRKILPKNVREFAVFDTAFHSTMDETAFLYGVPYEWYTKYKIRRYGFHGTSHKYVVNKALEMLGNKENRVISCHLGNGASICAANAGKCVDTSMGFTPLDGLVMGTRSGSIDPAIIPFICEKTNCSVKDIDTILNKKSGMLGISELSNDMRDLDEKAEEGHPGAIRALKMYYHSVLKVVGSYIAELGGTEELFLQQESENMTQG
jgi:acetate kinase